jgi:hypothetical protein
VDEGREASARSHSRLARISSPHTNVIVRSGGGMAFAAIASCSDRAISSSVPHPLASSFAPGSWMCATITMRSSGRVRPGISATSRRPGTAGATPWVVGANFVSTSTFTLTGPAFRRSFKRFATSGLARKPNARALSSYGTPPH